MESFKSILVLIGIVFFGIKNPNDKLKREASSNLSNTQNYNDSNVDEKIAA